MASTGNDSQIIQEQYRTSDNLDARIRLHLLFSTNTYGWPRWVLDQIEAPAEAHILEIGCGPASLWVENKERIPPGWQITLTDQSAGMITRAQANLAETRHPFRYERVDAQAIPFADATFDLVIANHMLYHVPDLPRSLGEIHRVLKPGGKLYAATNGEKHMYELRALIRQFAPALDYMASAAPPERYFSLENGAAHLQPWFPVLEMRRYSDGLAVTDATALVDYVFSMTNFTGVSVPDPAAARQAFTTYVQTQIEAQGGLFSIQKETGMFIGQKETP